MTALACGGLAGCGSSNNSTNSPLGDDGGEGGMGEGGDAQEEMSPTPEAGMDAANDSPPDVVQQDAPADSPVDSPVDAPRDAPKDAPMDAPGDGCTGAVAAFATSTIDEGAGNCGASAGVTKTFNVQNNGCANLTVSATIAGTVFSASPTMLTVAPGTTGTITIKAVVPASSTAGSAISGSMALTTNDPAHASATIPLSVMPTGATLAWAASSATTANFGVQPMNQAATPIALTLDNTGNAAASITMGTPSNSQFTLSPSNATIAAAGNASLQASFTPNSTTASTATSTFTVTGAICGTSVSSLTFSGQGGTGSVTGWPTATEDFGGGACGGSAPAAQTFTLTNSGPVAAHITAITFAGFSGYTTNATVGEGIPANGGSITVSLSAPAIPFPSAVPGNYAGSVTFTTDVAGDTPHQINLTEHAVGAILAWDTSATPGFGNFGTVPAGTNANQSFAVTNTGNATSSVTLAANTPFSILPATFNVSGGSNQSDSAAFSPQTFGPFTSSLAMSGTNLCQPVPSALSLTGTGQAGGLSLSSQSLAFTVNCGQAATGQTLILTNPGNASFNWNAQLPNGTNSDSLYTISPSSGTIAPNGGTATITVSPAAMPQYPTNTNPSAFADSITITTDIPNDTAHTVSISETPLGDILSVSPTSLSFGSIPISTNSPAQTFVVLNAANAGSPTANVTITSSDATDFPATPTSTTVAPGGQSGPISVQFDAPGSPGSYNSNIDISTTDVLCAPLPTSPAVAASGAATEAGPVYNPPSPLDFGLVNCGSTASPQQITATNSGTQTYTITGLALGKGASSPFGVAMLPANGVVTQTGSVTITVTPTGIPQNEPNNAVPDSGYWSDTLTIQTNANNGNPTVIYALTMGAKGVIITNNLASTNWSFGTVSFGSTGFFNNLIKNAGNDVAVATLTGLNYPNIFGLQGQPVTLPNGPMTLSGTFTPPSGSGTWADQGVLTIAPGSGAVLCEPLPASWQTPTINLTGSANNNPVISVSPNTLPFPTADCGGSDPAAQSVTITNNTGTAQSYTAVLGSTGTATGTYYSITSATPNPVPGGGTASISVQPTVDLTAGSGTSTGSSPYNDTLIITANGTNFDIPITMTVDGVILALGNPLSGSTSGTDDGMSCTSIPYNYYSYEYEECANSSVYNCGGGPYYYTGDYPIQVSNSGNIAGQVTVTLGGFAGPHMNVTGAQSVSSGQTATFVLSNGDFGGPYCDYNNAPYYWYGWMGGSATITSPNSCSLPIQASIASYFFYDVY
jgi:hypothetical protein